MMEGEEIHRQIGSVDDRGSAGNCSKGMFADDAQC